MEIKNNVAQNDTLNTIEAKRSGDIIHQSELFSSIFPLSSILMTKTVWQIASKLQTVQAKCICALAIHPDSQAKSTLRSFEALLLVFVIQNVHHNNFKLCNSNLEGSICHAAIHPSKRRKKQKNLFSQRIDFSPPCRSVGWLGRSTFLQTEALLSRKAIFS